MTWRLKVQGVLISLLVLGAIAAASGASWVEAYASWGWSW